MLGSVLGCHLGLSIREPVTLKDFCTVKSFIKLMRRVSLGLKL